MVPPGLRCSLIRTLLLGQVTSRVNKQTPEDDQTIIETHLTALKHARYSRQTLTARRRVIETLPHPLMAITHPQMDERWKSRQIIPGGKLRAPASLSQEMSHVRAFYDWAMRADLTARNPTDWIDPVRQKRHLPRPVSEGDLHKLLTNAEPDMRRMIALGAMAGLRSAEIAKVEWDDLDPGNGVLWVREGKGGKDRSVPLSAGLL